MKRGTAWGFAGVGAWMAACRWIPGLAGRWQGAALSALAALHRLTAPLPFPVVEVLGLALAGACLGRPCRLCRALLLVIGLYALLWYPAYFAAPAEAIPKADAGRLERLCDALADALSSVPESDPGPEPGVKLARYPEWMSALGVSGLFSPWTGEVIVDPATPAACAPFTRVHESMHMKGVADEGAANIAAYEECLRRGGAFAQSAKIWALRYALERLSALDPDAAGRAAARLDPALRALAAPREPSPEPNIIARLLGIARQTADYDALADWLANAL